MSPRLIKKYKNRRLYDTETSQYITLDRLQDYVNQGIIFKVEDSDSNKDLTNTILLQIIVEMEAGPNQFLSTDVLRQIIFLSNHPMNISLKNMMEQFFSYIKQTTNDEFYDKTSKMWQQWQNLFIDKK